MTNCSNLRTSLYILDIGKLMNLSRNYKKYVFRFILIIFVFAGQNGYDWAGAHARFAPAFMYTVYIL